MAHEFRTQRRVEFADTDMAGIIHFTSFFRYMEEAEHAFFRSLGLSVVSREKVRTITWPRVTSSCEFFQPVRFEDEVAVHLWVSRKGPTSLTHTITFHKDGYLIARGRITTVCCVHGAKQKLKPIPIPDFINRKIEVAPVAHEEETSTAYRKHLSPASGS